MARELVRQIDSSLLEEWEKLRHPESPEAVSTALDDRPAPVTANARAFRVLVRNALFRRVELAARQRWDALAALDGDNGWGEQAWRDAVEPYFDEHSEIGTGADARGPQLLMIDYQPDRWLVRQILDDPAGHHDWAITAEVDLRASDEAGVAVVRVSSVGPM